MIKVFRNTVSIQGKGAWGVLQFGSIAICLGRAKEGPRWQLVLFRPYSSQRFHFRVFGKRANPDDDPQPAK